MFLYVPCRGPNWVEEFPLHKAAYEGNAKEVKELTQKGYAVTKKDKDSWAPIHYAAWWVFYYFSGTVRYNIYLY